ncbi:MAG: YbaB/EbfC family nucleoid-associated protein, partial [Bacteroidia bacterium]|nr:YbaB/EbfC family nucleoid-associated protein [Bacteroidia bacterium]
MLGKLKELKEMQAKAEEIKKRLDSITVRGTAAEDKIQVMCTGNKQVQNVVIDESLLNEINKTQLEQSMVEAIN